MPFIPKNALAIPLLLLVIPGGWLPTPVSAQPESGGARTRVVLLGTGTPNADPDRSGPSVAVVVDGTAYLVDAGPGVVRRAAAAYRAGVEGLQAERLETVFITHLHSDHTVGLPDLIFTPWVLGRSEPLAVYGPDGIRAMTEHLLAAYQQDVYMRLYGLEPTAGKEDGYRVIAHEVEPGVVYRDSSVMVEAFSVPHGSWPRAYGYTFTTPDRTIVISGDTAPGERIVEMCNGCDVLIHEVYSAKRFETRSPEWQRYHASFHTSTLELADIASRAKPRLLVLYHQLYWGATDAKLLEEIRAVYSGEVVSGRDLDVY